MTTSPKRLRVNLKADHWLRAFADQPEDVLLILLEARDELAQQKAQEAGTSLSLARGMISQLLNAGTIRFVLRRNILGEIEGVDVHAAFDARERARHAFKSSIITR